MRTLTALVALLVCSSPAVAFPDPNSDDCIVSREVSPHAKVDCTYKYEYEKILNYFIRIHGTRQPADGWAIGIKNNIKGICGEPTHFENNVRDLGTHRQGTDTTTWESYQLIGPSINLHFKSWTAGEDNIKCVQDAIRAATCESIELVDNVCRKIK